MHNTTMATVSIVGASGYAGQETLDRVLAHPALELYALGSDTLAGETAGSLDPRLGRNGWARIPRFITNDAALSCGADVVFVCLPHQEAAAIDPPSRGVVVDLSGAHRFSDPHAYRAWYGLEHPRPAGLSAWSYGLPEVTPPSGRLVANPGCYATAVLLALAPLKGLVEESGAVVDAKSGMTGAGRTLRASSHAGAVLENVTPYRVGEHQHAPEIAAHLGFPVTFVPHLLPVRRGLLATCVVRPRGLLRRESRRGRAPRRGRSRARARPANGRCGDRCLRGQAHRKLDRHLCPRQPRQGCRRPGDSERESPLRAGRDDRASPGLGPRLMSVTAASGFVAAGVHAGIRRSGPDLALVRSAVPAVGTAVWTTNRVLAAPVVVSKRHLELAEPQAVVVNAGAERTAAEAASATGLEPEQVIVLSTGVIGVPLPLEKVLAGVRAVASMLAASGGDLAASAILTTDRWPKQAQARGDGFVVGGMAKGAGMIHPRLATMLAVLTTDYPLETGETSAFLRPAVDGSFNRISVDGECSTNDAVVLLANGASAVGRTHARDAEFAEALSSVCAALAREIVADGEGATVLLEIEVSGAASDGEAEAVARRLATSPLVKTAAFGRDPNWGRVLAAAGSAPWNGGFAVVDADRLTVSFDGTAVFVRGEPTGARPELAGSAVAIELDLGIGQGNASYLASDLTVDYVRLNAEYTT